MKLPSFRAGHVRWSGVVPARTSTGQVAITMDWTATILAAAQAEASFKESSPEEFRQLKSEFEKWNAQVLARLC